MRFNQQYPTYIFIGKTVHSCRALTIWAIKRSFYWNSFGRVNDDFVGFNY